MRASMLIRVVRSLFALSFAAMAWWAFLWPVVISTDPDSPIFRLGSIGTLLVFFCCLVLLLCMQRRGPGTD